MSLPTRKCGLKCWQRSWLYRDQCHFLHGSVDWNGALELYLATHFVSLPTRKCGLKLTKQAIVHLLRLSLPTRKCGLKSIQSPSSHCWYRVTSYTEVWIEIPFCPHIIESITSHFLHGSVDWNSTQSVVLTEKLSHFLHGSVDWNLLLKFLPSWYPCHFLYTEV